MFCDYLYILVLFYLFYCSKALRWTQYVGTPFVTETSISLMTATESPQIDVSSGAQITIIKNAKQFESGIFIYCFISGYSNNAAVEYSFCKNDHDCLSVKDHTYSKLNHFSFIGTVESNYTDQKGMKLHLQLSGSIYDFSGSYYCKASNNNFEIRSNIIEIRDIIYWQTRLYTSVVPSEVTSVKLITLSSIPQVLKCSGGSSVLNPVAPRWTKIEFFSPVQWSVCPVLKGAQSAAEKNKMTLNKCLQFTKDKCEDSIDRAICPMSVQQMTEWKVYVNQVGDLIITKISPTQNSAIDSYSFMCYTKKLSEDLDSLFYYYEVKSGETIAKGISFDAITPASNVPLVAISPLIQTFTLYARKIAKEEKLVAKPMGIYALYQSSPTAVHTWKHGDTIVNENLSIEKGKYTLTFLGDVTSDNAGTYTLDVTDGSQKITMTMNVIVLGPPIVLSNACMKPLQFVWDGLGANFSCSYKQRPTDIKIMINGQEIKLSDTLENSKANLKKTYPYLEMLSFSMSPTNFVVSDIATISYEVKQLTKSQGQEKFQDHTVTFLVTNDFGMNVKSSSIYVLPLLKNVVTNFPQKYNCTSPCSSAVNHTFRCDIRVEEYDNKELIIEHYWTINSYRLGDRNSVTGNMYAPYFLVDPITKELTMLPIRSNNSDNDKRVKDSLKSNNIVCNLNLLHNKAGSPPFSYMSSVDASVMNDMQARITLDYEPISTAYIYWVVAVILGFIVLVIIIVLLTRYCMKNKGDTYQLDKLERQHGYDPEKEVQEEIFKPYERQDHEETALDDTEGRKLSVTGHSIGSNDDGDLDNYELDPSNFNEDGSFTGKYSSNPRNRAALS